MKMDTTDGPHEMEVGNVESDNVPLEQTKTIGLKVTIEQVVHGMGALEQLGDDHYDSDADLDYQPIGESDTEDELEDNELSDDENRTKFRKYISVDEVTDKFARNTGLQKLASNNVDEGNNEDNDQCLFEYTESDGDVNSVGTSEEDNMDEKVKRLRKR